MHQQHLEFRKHVKADTITTDWRPPEVKRYVILHMKATASASLYMFLKNTLAGYLHVPIVITHRL